MNATKKTQSRFIYRDTGREPSKSGVIGLLCAALGKPRREKPEDGWPTLRQLAELRMGVRVDREGRLECDYQTAENVAEAHGKGSRTVQSWRYFLSDADFLVGLEGDRALLERLNTALRSPVWHVYLGRKSFVLSVPAYLPDRPPWGPGLRDAPLDEALRSIPWHGRPGEQPPLATSFCAGRRVGREYGDALRRATFVRCACLYFPQRYDSIPGFCGGGESMWLSRLILNPRSRTVRRDLSDCHQLHRTLLGAFPSVQESEPRRKIGLLHRLEQLAGHPVLLVQSLIQPDWSTLPADYCLPALSGVENPAVKPVADVLGAIRNGARYRFRLTANPTRRITRDVPANGGTPSGRVELRTEEQWTDWMLRQSQKHGFRVERLRADPTLPNLVGLLAGRLQGRRNGDRVTVFAVRFDGVLEVVNVDEFREAVRSGVGPAKAYGCGLLSIGSTAQSEQTPGKLDR